MLAVHLSRMSEEIILWSSSQFDYIQLPEELCTGSSIMPQKKNPDMAELIRGGSSQTLGNLVTTLSLMKNQSLHTIEIIRKTRNLFLNQLISLRMP